MYYCIMEYDAILKEKLDRLLNMMKLENNTFVK